jgi:hypothetical protein
MRRLRDAERQWLLAEVIDELSPGRKGEHTTRRAPKSRRDVGAVGRQVNAVAAGGRDEAGLDVFHHDNRARCGSSEEPFPHGPTIDGLHFDKPGRVTALDPIAGDGGEARLRQEPGVLDHQPLPELVANPAVVRQARVRRPRRRRFTHLFPTHAEERDGEVLGVGRREVPQSAWVAPGQSSDVAGGDRPQRELSYPQAGPFSEFPQRDHTAVGGRAALVPEEGEQVYGGWGAGRDIGTHTVRSTRVTL